MYKITYDNGYVRYSKHQYGKFGLKGKPGDVVKSEEVINEENGCPDGHWLFSGESK